MNDLEKAILAARIKRGWAAEEVAPAATPKADGDDESKPATRSYKCTKCGASNVVDWKTDSESSEIGMDDDVQEHGEGADIDDTPAWENAGAPGLSWRTRKATNGERRTLKRD
jgi:hypothetical protein